MMGLIHVNEFLLYEALGEQSILFNNYFKEFMNRFTFLFMLGFPCMLFAQTLEPFQAVVRTTNPQRVQREKRARVLFDHAENNVLNLNNSSSQQSKNSNTAHATVSPSEGFVLGTTDYDYVWNSGSRRTIVVNAAGTNVHMVWMERNLSLIPPKNKCTMKYGYYDWSLGTVITGYPEQNVITASGLGNVDVFWGGDKDNIAAICGGTPIWFAIDRSPGAANFTKTNIGVNESTGPAMTIDNSNAGTIYLTGNNGARNNYFVQKSTDYGSTWAMCDSLLVHSPFVTGNLDVEVLVAPNGNLFLPTCLSGYGTINQVSADSADCVGYYKSTDQGSHWTWTTIAHDGDLVAYGSENVTNYFENFGSMDASIDKDNNLHIVIQGYGQKLAYGTTDIVAANYFGTLYWKTGQSGFKLISRPEDAHIADFDSSYYTEMFSGNAFGHPYPSISVDPAGDGLFAIWSQTRITNGKLDVAYNGISQYDLWYSFSTNGGTSWSTAQKLANSDGGLFVSAAPKLTVIDGNTYRAHCIYIADTTAGCAVVGQSAATQVPVVYRTIDFFYEGSITGSSPIVDNHSGLPKYYSLLQNYPNPCNPSTRIEFALPKHSFVTLKVYDVLGKEVATLLNSAKEAGIYTTTWNAEGCPSGVYFYRLSAGSYTMTRKLLLLR